MTPQELLAKLETWGIAHDTIEHAAIFTVAESQALDLNLDSAGHTKNLYLRDKKKNNFLVTTHEDAVIDLTELAKKIGTKRLSFGRPERLLEFLGITPGAVSPLALANDPEAKVTFWIDSNLMAADKIHLHPLVNTMTSSVTPDALKLFVEKAGHQLNVLDHT